MLMIQCSQCKEKLLLDNPKQNNCLKICFICLSEFVAYKKEH